MTKSMPVKHHYIPQFILARFADSDKKIHTFNKETGGLGRKFSPAGICYTEHLHTFTFDGEKHAEMEVFYSKLENEFRTIIEMVDKHIEDKVFMRQMKEDEVAKKTISLFLTLSFWRIPKRHYEASAARKNLRSIYDKAPAYCQDLIGFDRRTLRDLERKDKETSIKLAQFFILPALLSDMHNNSIKNCFFHRSEFDLIISDDPVIGSLNKDFALFGDIYFPIGSRLCITNAPEKINIFQERMYKNATKLIMANSDTCFHFFKDVLKKSACG